MGAFKMSKKDEEKLNQDGSSRRDFLKNSGLATGGVAVGATLGGVFGLGGKDEESTTTSEGTKHDHALEHFTNRAEFKILEQATERVLPEDYNGPGAIGLGVAYYIDHQLAGKWGINAKDYRQGPFYEGEPTQGYQTQLRYHRIYDLGIEALEKYSKAAFDEGFSSLEDEQQDEVLVAFENDKVDMPGIKSSFFFEIKPASLHNTHN